MNYLEFVETSAFSGLRKELMDDDEFRELQTYLLEARWRQSDLLRSPCQRQIIPASDIP